MKFNYIPIPDFRKEPIVSFEESCKIYFLKNKIGYVKNKIGIVLGVCKKVEVKNFSKHAKNIGVKHKVLFMPCSATNLNIHFPRYVMIVDSREAANLFLLTKESKQEMSTIDFKM